MEGRRITWSGTYTKAAQADFAALHTALQASFGVIAIGLAGPFAMPSGGVVAAALYTEALWTFHRAGDATSGTLYIEVLWFGVPDMAGLKTLVASTFGFVGARVIEDVVTL